MSLRYPEAVLFCVAWAALAFLGWSVAGWTAGILLGPGLFLVIMPATILVLTRTGSFARERAVRWGILGIAALALAVTADLSP